MVKTAIVVGFDPQVTAGNTAYGRFMVVDWAMIFIWADCYGSMWLKNVDAFVIASSVVCWYRPVCSDSRVSRCA